MSYTNRNIIGAYSSLFGGREDKTRDDAFYKSFGAFASKKSVEKIVTELRASRKFRAKEIKR